MLVKVDGIPVSIVADDKGVLLDSKGGKWTRSAQYDTENMAAYTSSIPGSGVMKLTRQELKRIVKGRAAILATTTVDEIREYMDRVDRVNAAEVAKWSNQQLREILAEADYSGVAVLKVLYDKIEECRKGGTPEPKEAPPTEGSGRMPSRPPRAKRRPKKRHSRAVSPDEFEYESETGIVVLTQKQVEFLERMSENPNWEDAEENGWYYTDDYSAELSDTMGVTTVGAMVSTLKEKGVIQTEYIRMGGMRRCKFKLTELGVKIYRVMARKEN